ncbi:SMP-30/gluconolactonase/LRE family protein [Achromobacter deleyi]|uniref:SMP-30/gluconolactonase/LRE family protein n=1 Tax=Achromobacter deleyi TaxID=1353891 RepID=UPI0014932448|nr:SMP-30/gluconolactonase/LRE family protein [Achromobacter deleyi]QVQ28206.1 SMP-30/gluconolactonase/LRE family protein [Achromobacter deleyi]UIP18398.1 SMP-30/gluconolactonase/LRE family protein [Achromobacter deleyi]
MWEPSESYPDPAIEVLDPRFLKYRIGNAAVERLATGIRYGEGPVWFGDGRYLLWSDIPNNRIMRWDEESGAVSVYRKPSGYANGNTRDRQGRLLSCEHGGRRVVRTEYDGTLTVLAERFQGKRLNSPNDIVVKRDDSIWFSDPVFGILNDYEGFKTTPELPTCVYRLDPASGRMEAVVEDIPNPNGLCFSPDERLLYIVDNGSRPNRILVYEVAEGGTLTHGRTFVDAGDQGLPDGIRCDTDGNVWAGWGSGPALNGVMVFAPDGAPIGRIDLPDRCANLCFGGARRNRLFMVAGQCLFSLYVDAQGAAHP